MVPARTTREAGNIDARLLRLERDQSEVPGRSDHLQGHRDLELDVGPRRECVLLAPVFLAPARSQLRQPEGARSDVQVFFFQAEDGIRDYKVTGVQTCALPI